MTLGGTVLSGMALSGTALNGMELSRVVLSDMLPRYWVACHRPVYNQAIQCRNTSLFIYTAGLEVWINSFIKDIGLKPFVLPSGLTIPLVPGRADGLVVCSAASFFFVCCILYN